MTHRYRNLVNVATNLKRTAGMAEALGQHDDFLVLWQMELKYRLLAREEKKLEGAKQGSEQPILGGTAHPVGPDVRGVRGAGGWRELPATEQWNQERGTPEGLSQLLQRAEEVRPGGAGNWSTN